MLHELCFNYMWFHELHTKSYCNYEFKGFKTNRNIKKVFHMANLDL